MPMKYPPHLGLSVRNDCLEPLGLSVTKGAKALGMTRQALSNLVNCKSGVSSEMAIRFDKMGWGTVDGWIGVQIAYDLAQARRKAAKIKVTPYKKQKESAQV